MYSSFQKLVWRHQRCVGIALALMMLGSTAAAATAVTNRFERLRQQDLRITTVAYRLAKAGAARCIGGLTPLSGVALHGLGQYSLEERSRAATSFGLGLSVGIMGVVAGSPAARAGLRENDQLVSVNGITLERRGDAVPDRASVDRVEILLERAMANDAVVVRVMRADGQHDLRFKAEAGCPARAELIVSNSVNAWADGDRVKVTSALVDASATDDELALVIGHEMAHNILHHRQQSGTRPGGQGIVLATAPRSARMRQEEQDADRFAVRLMNSAGYDVHQAQPLLRRLLRNDGIAPLAARTHPATRQRLALLALAIADTLAEAKPHQSLRLIAGKTSASVRVSGNI